MSLVDVSSPYPQRFLLAISDGELHPLDAGDTETGSDVRGRDALELMTYA